MRSLPSPTMPPLPRPAAGLLAATLALFLLAGCGVVEKDQRAVGLQAATNGYQSALRWGYYDNAYGFLPPNLRKDRSLDSAFVGLRLTGYDVMQPPTMLDRDTATQIVAIDYLYSDRQIVKQLVDRQLWRWDEKEHVWLLASGLPKFD